MTMVFPDGLFQQDNQTVTLHTLLSNGIRRRMEWWWRFQGVALASKFLRSLSILCGLC